MRAYRKIGSLTAGPKYSLTDDLEKDSLVEVQIPVRSVVTGSGKNIDDLPSCCSLVKVE